MKLLDTKYLYDSKCSHHNGYFYLIEDPELQFFQIIYFRKIENTNTKRWIMKWGDIGQNIFILIKLGSLKNYQGAEKLRKLQNHSLPLRTEEYPPEANQTL